MNTFSSEIRFMTKVPSDNGSGGIDWIDQEVSKTAKFKELNQTDKEQHKLHFKIISLMEGSNVSDDEDDANDSSVTFNTDKFYDLTTKAIKSLLIIDKDSFSEEDKTAFLNDSAAILRFGMFLLKDKFVPFFQRFKLT